jgi:hypothetical protein
METLQVMSLSFLRFADFIFWSCLIRSITKTKYPNALYSEHALPTLVPVASSAIFTSSDGMEFWVLCNEAVSLSDMTSESAREDECGWNVW